MRISRVPDSNPNGSAKLAISYVAATKWMFEPVRAADLRDGRPCRGRAGEPFLADVRVARYPQKPIVLASDNVGALVITGKVERQLPRRLRRAILFSHGAKHAMTARRCFARNPSQERGHLLMSRPE
jgi:hypothetical protein